MNILMKFGTHLFYVCLFSVLICSSSHAGELAEAILRMGASSSDEVRTYIENYESLSEQLIEDISNQTKEKLDEFRKASDLKIKDSTHHWASLFAFNRDLVVPAESYFVAINALLKSRVALKNSNQDNLLSYSDQAKLFSCLGLSELIWTTAWDLMVGESWESALNSGMWYSCMVTGVAMGSYYMGSMAVHVERRKAELPRFITQNERELSFEGMRSATDAQSNFNAFLREYFISNNTLEDSSPESSDSGDESESDNESKHAFLYSGFDSEKAQKREREYQEAEREIGKAIAHLGELEEKSVVQTTVRLIELYFLALKSIGVDRDESLEEDYVNLRIYLGDSEDFDLAQLKNLYNEKIDSNLRSHVNMRAYHHFLMSVLN